MDSSKKVRIELQMDACFYSNALFVKLLKQVDEVV
jgi:hypothetical protein